MVLSASSKINDVLSEYPFIKDFLIELNPHFEALNNPVMRRTLGRVATLSKAAFIGGVEPEQLVADIAAEIKKKTGQEVEVEVSTQPVEDAAGEHAARIEVLKSIIKELHAGARPADLKERFRELISDVGPSEIAEMEQALINEGMPSEEVKKLCEVHVEVFREGLDKGVVPGLPAGHPVHTFMLENRAAEAIISKLEAALEPEPDIAALKEQMERLSDITIHYQRKENQLFPLLEANGISGPSKVMWALHDDIRAMLKDVRGKLEGPEFSVTAVKAAAHMVADMIYKEERILYPMSLEALNEEDWARVRKGEEEIGYAWIQPEEGWEPMGGTAQAVLIAEKVGSLNLDTGQLTAEQVNLMLTHLPLDVSFVNEHDEVIYYSATEDRIFPRSPGVIGRKVQNCHPSKSVEVVEKILSEFKAGRKDSADFWIEMAGKFILIKYFAVRDSDGNYRGTLEVSQDVTSIRKLTGQRRLLDW